MLWKCNRNKCLLRGRGASGSSVMSTRRHLTFRRGAGSAQQRCRIIKQARKRKKNWERRGKKRGGLWAEVFRTKLYAPSGGRWAAPVCSSWGGQNGVISISPELWPSGQNGFAEIMSWSGATSVLGVSLLRSLTCRAAAAGLWTSSCLNEHVMYGYDELNVSVN